MKGTKMFPTINLRETGINLRRIMDKRGIEAKDIQEYLNLASVQSVYNWCNGLNMPTIDNLYALSQLLQVSIDEIVCGNRKAIIPKPIVILENSRDRRLYSYYRKLNKILAA
ncbi:MAG: helix-turn-helix transcriptional regulator [Roseburia sp.]|nr:helix-turn-helix transcriptional regulator [Roseburia sp.]